MARQSSRLGKLNCDDKNTLAEIKKTYTCSQTCPDSKAMLNIESEISEINTSAEKTFAFLCSMDNWKELMPQQVTKWESSPEACSFVLGGMATIALRISEKTPNSILLLKSEGKSPFPFELRVKLDETGPASCKVQLLFNGDMNTMMRMMAEKPLTNFFTYLSHKMRGIQ